MSNPSWSGTVEEQPSPPARRPQRAAKAGPSWAHIVAAGMVAILLGTASGFGVTTILTGDDGEGKRRAESTDGASPSPGSAESPVRLGDSRLLAGWHLTVVSADPFADRLLAHPPEPGVQVTARTTQHLMVRLRAVYAGDDEQVFRQRFRATLADQTSGASFDVSPSCEPAEALRDDMTVSTGAILEGHLCWEVPMADSSTLQLVVSTPAPDEETASFVLFPDEPFDAMSVHSIADALNVGGVGCSIYHTEEGWALSLPSHTVALCESFGRVDEFLNDTILLNIHTANPSDIEYLVHEGPAQGLLGATAVIGDTWLVTSANEGILRDVQAVLGGELKRLQS